MFLLFSKSSISFATSGNNALLVIFTSLSTCSGNISLENKVCMASCVVTFIISQLMSFVSPPLEAGNRWWMLYFLSLLMSLVKGWNNPPYSLSMKPLTYSIDDIIYLAYNVVYHANWINKKLIKTVSNTCKIVLIRFLFIFYLYLTKYWLVICLIHNTSVCICHNVVCISYICTLTVSTSCIFSSTADSLALVEARSPHSQKTNTRKLIRVAGLVR